MIFRLLIGSGILLFTMEHPYFVALSAVLYLFSQAIKEEEKTMLKDFASKGTDWLRELNAFSRKQGISMKKGREITSDLVETFYKNLTKEQVDQFLSNDRLQDKVNRVISDELTQEENVEDEWEAFPLSESDLLDSEEVSFISHFAPNFDWDEPYTYKMHRQLFKTLKAKFRTNDGSITNEAANELVLSLEDWVYSFMTGTESSLYGNSEIATNYLIEWSEANV